MLSDIMKFMFPNIYTDILLENQSMGVKHKTEVTVS